MTASAPTDPAALLKFQNGAASLLRVRVDELVKVQAVSAAVMAAIQAADAEQKVYLNQRAKLDLPAEPPKLKQYADRRAAAVASGVNNLKLTLGAASWDGLHTFVNVYYRQNVHAQAAK